MVGKQRGRHGQNRLDAKKVAALVRKGTAGKHYDGGGLLLLIKSNGAASWILRAMVNRKRRDLGLGGADVVSLAQAREKARELRALLKAGGDPLEAKRKARSILTFEEVARKVHADHKGAWKNLRHSAQWLSSLERYAFPVIGSMRVDLVGVPECLQVLQPIWLTLPETARRLRQRLRTVFDVAKAKGYRDFENPIGVTLDKALPRQSGEQGHHAALPYAEVPALFARLEDADGGPQTPRLALKLLILAVSRTGEVLGARRDEFDLDARVWTVPPERMKAGKPHKVPLSDAALSIVRRALQLSSDPQLLFPGRKRGKALSGMALLKLLRRLGVRATAHGFRSSFKDWCSETTGFPNEVSELALAHSPGSKVERAYARSDLFERRRELMVAWGRFVTSGANVVSIQRKAAG